MDLETRKAIFQESLDANVRFLFDRTVSLMDRNGSEIGSGTLFRIQDRVLIATAKHLIKGDPNGRIWPIIESPRFEKDGFPRFASFAKHPTLDVAYLEIDPEGAEEYFGNRVYASLDEIGLESTGRPGKSVIVAGSPGEHVTIKRNSSDSTSLNARVMFFLTFPVQVEKWPENQDDPLNCENDFVVNYPSDKQMIEEGFPPIFLPHPGGISGGGFWDQGFESGALWSPDKSRLVAIQSRWNSRMRYLRAIQIRHWLCLVYSKFPDLREAITNLHGKGPWNT